MNTVLLWLASSLVVSTGTSNTSCSFTVSIIMQMRQKYCGNIPKSWERQSLLSPDKSIATIITIVCDQFRLQYYNVSLQEARLSPRDRAMLRVSWNLVNCHATVQKLLVRQVLNKSKLGSWRVTMGQCVIKCALNHDAIESLSLSYRCHEQTDHGRVVDVTCIPTTCCCEIF